MGPRRLRSGTSREEEVRTDEGLRDPDGGDDVLRRVGVRASMKRILCLAALAVLVGLSCSRSAPDPVPVDPEIEVIAHFSKVCRQECMHRADIVYEFAFCSCCCNRMAEKIQALHPKTIEELHAIEFTDPPPFRLTREEAHACAIEALNKGSR